jgi:predicted O-methyltransferase YrrM
MPGKKKVTKKDEVPKRPKKKKETVEKKDFEKTKKPIKFDFELSKKGLLELQKYAQRPCPPEVEAMLELEQDTPVVTGTPAHYCRFFYFLSQFMQPKVVIDIGTHKGMSSGCLAAGAPEAAVYTVDIQNKTYKEVCSLPNVIRRINQIKDPIDSVDILFIDAEHDGEQPKQQFYEWAPKLKVGSIVMFDDINLNPEMKEFWKNFHPGCKEKFELDVHADAGFGVIIL